MSGFLRYVVGRTLAGEGDQIKEYVIGVAVFGRGDDYDPRLDSIVRVEARRLRTKLDEYYAADGRDDTIVIAIPRGSYSPTFEKRTPQLAGSQSRRLRRGPDDAAAFAARPHRPGP